MTRISAQWFAAQRWFAQPDAGSPTPADAPTTTLDGRLRVTIVRVGHDHYQLVSSNDTPDSITDARTVKALKEAFDAKLRASGPAGKIVFHLMPGAAHLTGTATGAATRLLSGDQSNSSVILGNGTILKVLRRLQTGVHPEVEMLGALSERECSAVPALLGWYEVSGGPIDATLGILQHFIDDGVDGWRLILDLLTVDPPTSLALLHRLGSTLAGVHSVLASHSGLHSNAGNSNDFAPERPGRAYATGLGASTAAAAIETAERLDLTPHPSAEIVDLAAMLRTAGALAAELAQPFEPGAIIRHHGDLHLGQTLHTPRGWMIVDWEGEPLRSLAERRSKASPLRDLAGLLRSLSYASATQARSAGGAEVPGWLSAARAALLDGYLSVVDPDLLPAGAETTSRLLTLFELEKCIYEVNYELANRPDWLAVPAVGLAQLLARSRR